MESNLHSKRTKDENGEAEADRVSAKTVADGSIHGFESLNRVLEASLKPELFQMASSQTNDSTQFKICRCGEGDKCIWTPRASESSDNQSNRCPNCEILKNGPLFISSKGIGWTSWKKRWFVLSRTSLMFYRADPNALPQKGNEVPNPTLGGIELNNSGSVVVKPDKKLLTVLFPDGRDGRAFTLKTETIEELNEWKAALESALAQAPNAAQVMGQNGIFRNEVADSIEASVEQCNDKPPFTSSVIGRPVILALEDIDGSPSFLEKALRFIEEHGIKVEGILRQSADVDEVVHRVQEYEQGKKDFSPDEDAHVIGDCIKHVLREMPSSPVPASCCTSLVDAYRTDRGSRINAIRDAIYEIFPEPNYRLLQRILQMMLTVAAHKAENRMSLSALAACMAPLLLRPLLAGECELKNDFQMDGDGSFQLLQAAAAANHAQAIVIILLEEYEHIFDDESFSSELYTESEDDGEDIEDDESTDNDIPGDDSYHDAEKDLKANRGNHRDLPDSGTPSKSCSEVGGDVGIEDGSYLGSDVGSDVGSGIGSDTDSGTGSSVGSDAGSDVGSNGGCAVHNAVSDINCDSGSNAQRNFSKDEDIKDPCTHSMPTRNIEVVERTTTNSKNVCTFPPEDIDLKPSTSGHAQLSVPVLSFGTDNVQKDDCFLSVNSNSTVPPCHKSQNSSALALSTTVANKLANIIPPVLGIANAEKSNKAQPAMRNKWGRTSARKNLSMESIEYISDDESAIQSLESTKIDLQTKISKEIEGKAVLQANLDKRKEALHERRLALQKEVVRLQEQLKKERALRLDLESGLRNMQTGNLSTSACLDSKTRTDLEEIALTERDIINLEQNITDLNDKLHQGCAILCESCGQPTYTRNKSQKNVDDISHVQKNDNSMKHDNSKLVEGCEDIKWHKQESPCLAKKQSSPKPINKTNLSNDSYAGVPNVVCGDFMKKSTSRAENSLTNADSENLKDQAKSSSSGDRQSFQKLLPRFTNHISSRSSGATAVSYSEDRPSASKKTARRDSMNKDAPDSPSARRLPSQKKQPSTSHLNIEKSTEPNCAVFSEDQIALIRNNATRRPAPKSVEVASTSSALTKLTNRLNFLKERRAQLANELQNLDFGRVSGPEAPSKTNSS